MTQNGSKLRPLHYHVMFGQHGCLPDHSILCLNLLSAKECLKEEKANAIAAGYKLLSGSMSQMMYEFDRNCYADIEYCYEESCLQNQEMLA